MQRLWILLVTACSGATPSGATTASGPAEDTISDPLPTGAPGRLAGRLQVQPASQCGGAMPEPGYVSPPMAPAPSVPLDVTVGGTYRGHRPVLELTTDAEGLFGGELPAGRYCLTLRGRGPRPANAGRYYDLACLVTQWERCDAVIDVPVSGVVAIDHQEPCPGLSCYNGPPPP